MELTKELRSVISGSLAAEWAETNVDEELDGGNDSFFIRPCFAFTGAGDPFLAYGVFNRNTGIREAETIQYAAAKQWVEALTRISKGEDMPGLGKRVTTMAKAAEGAE